LQSIVDTEISPELIPSTDANANQPGQSTEAKIGPYNLQDFHLYYITRYGFRPSKVAYLAHCAWSDTYDLPTIKKWLEGFLWRFFKTSQFKRTCVPNSPKVGSGGSLSPRGDWRAPSDSEATVWLEELKNNVP
jgi:NAD+ synthase (glutamine-hydrolysing)